MLQIPNNIASYLNYNPVRTLGNSLIYRNFTPPDIIGHKWAGCTIVQKTQTSQAQDHACIFRVMQANSRITLTVRTGGYVNLRIYKSGGSIQRDVQTTAVPTLNHVFLIGYSWDETTAALTVYDWTAKTLVESKSQSTNASGLPSWTESDGLYIGNREDLTLPYRGKIYGGCFGRDNYYSTHEMEHEFGNGNTCLGRSFLMHPQIMGIKGSDTIREPNHLNMTIVAPDLGVFWNN